MTEPATRRAFELIDGYQTTCVILAACRLRLFEILRNGPISAEALTSRVAADGNSLFRLLRAICALGLIECTDTQISLTEDGRAFGGEGIRDLPTLVGEQYLMSWAALADTVATGRPAFWEAVGMTAWEHRRRKPEINDAFNRFMSLVQKTTLQTLYASYDFAAFSCIADIGGGSGQLLAGILERCPDIRGVLFDQPHVVHRLDVLLERADIRARCEVVSGSFFEAVPRGASLYVLQHILHDWSDDECLRILGTCREAMDEASTLIILEKAMPSCDRVPRFLAMRDLHMMTVLGGQERTLEQYAGLLAAAGFRVDAHRSLPPHCPDIIEARPRRVAQQRGHGIRARAKRNGPSGRIGATVDL